MSVETTKIDEFNSVNDIDFDNLKLQRGKTPEDIKQTCLKLCKEYLSGNWLEQTSDTIEVRRVSGGLTNQLYYCGIAKPSDTSAVPQEVAIRLYGVKHITTSAGKERLSDVVISLLVSETQLGPKVYGVFEEGQIHHFYKHRIFKYEEQKDPSLAMEVFQKLARVHAMQVPIPKKHWYFIEYDRIYSSVEKHLANGLPELINELNLTYLKKFNFKEELNWIKEMIVKSGSPLVFCHNDFRSSNIMVLEDKKDNVNTGCDGLVLCDFEYSSYGYRGHDFGTIIKEWGRTWNELKELHKFPDDSTLKGLIEIYIEESKRILGQNYSNSRINSVDQIIKEVKLFCLSSNLWFTLWCLREKEELKDSFPLDLKFALQFCEIAYMNYWHLKDQFIKEHAFDF